MVSLNNLLYPFAVVFMWWSVQLGGVLGWIKFWSTDGRRNDVHEWARFCSAVFGVQLYKSGEKDLYEGANCMYLCNHRSWADFFLDVVINAGRSCALGRRMVLVGFPSFMAYAWVLGAISFFDRRVVKDKEKFNKWVDNYLKQTPYPGIIIYPEGHRNIATKPLELKRGMLKYAFSRQMTMQIVIATGKEGVINERENSIHFGQKINIAFSDIIKAKEFSDFEDFFCKIQQVWDHTWARVYSESEAITAFRPKGYICDYTVKQRIGAMLVMTVTIGLMFVHLWLTWKYTAWIVSLLLSLVYVNA